ncbi:sigma-70 family RNA polymerase sigma factor [Actinacidiphila paucisporea]|uniref:RNA polymerase sigma-70 factor, ECF subfamily n=1 Tax=Actinacidiphila paucisporea TaxID=310782 RepID=A0A1M7R0L1_9ACTN|nr:sigma-70 family RNA polymerase sigma factor [Actinacidiphila paucisporea]SHN38075.1 RNA polymerase sigma-70 factor, ECF subfamily [Actinacidiphila paucisporea]
MSGSNLPGRRARRSRVIERPQPVDFTVFHTTHRGAYVRWASLYLGSRADAEDAVDDAMLEMLGKWPTVLSQPEPAAYAWTIVKSRTRDAARARDRRQKVISMAAVMAACLGETIDPIGELETSMAVQQAVEDLPERQHDVFVLRFGLEYTVRETAEHLGITEATVRSTLRDARRRLKAALGLD